MNQTGGEMELLAEIKYRLKSIGPLILGLFFVSYFIFYGVKGDRGVLKYLYLKRQISETQKVAQEYNLQKVRLEEKVKRLSNNSLDLDLLEERARIVLNFAANDEFIVLDEK